MLANLETVTVDFTQNVCVQAHNMSGYVVHLYNRTNGECVLHYY